LPTLRKEISNYYQSRKKISIPIKIGLDGYANDWINTKLVKNYQVKSEIADGLD